MTVFDDINKATAFAEGDEFESEAAICEYFTPDTQRQIFGEEAETDTETLATWARLVLDNRWHCRF